VVTYVSCALTVLMALVFLAFAAFVGSLVLPHFEAGDRADMALVVVVPYAVATGGSALACWFAWQVSRRRPWARIGLAGCSAAAGILSVAYLAPPTAVVLPGAVAVLVLLFLPPSNGWFRKES
jgi:hypothetical protein